MIEKLAWSVTSLFVEREVILKEDDEIYAYGFECLIADSIQYMILFIAGLLLGRLIPLALISAGFIAMKRHVGGYHANSHFTCLLITSSGLICGSLACAALPYWASALFLPAAWIIIFVRAPIVHENNPKTEDEIKIMRKLSLRNAAVITVASIFLSVSPFKAWAAYPSGGLLLSAFTLLIPCGKSK